MRGLDYAGEKESEALRREQIVQAAFLVAAHEGFVGANPGGDTRPSDPFLYVSEKTVVL